MRKLELDEVYHMDCLEGMAMLPDASIDLIYCDLPYGVTENKWDEVIPFESLWEQYNRLIKDRGAIVLHSQQPFTTDLINSNRKHFRYTWVWSKSLVTGALNARRRPMREHEDICVFYKRLGTYNPQMQKGKMRIRKAKIVNSTNYKSASSYTARPRKSDLYYPKSIIHCPATRRKGQHPTEKPVPLAEYLIKTYTNPGEVVLDNCLGSGTTALAAENTGRRWIGFEAEARYVEMARERLHQNREKNSHKHENFSRLHEK